MEVNIHPVLEGFGVARTTRVEEFDSGLINRSYHVVTDEKEYVLQRINKEVFEDGEKLMLNILIANDELRKINDYQVPEIILSLEGKPLVADTGGYDWRLMKYISNCTTYDQSNDPQVGAEVGRILGNFHLGTSTCDPTRMYVTLPDFHNLSFRLEWFLQSLQRTKPHLLAETYDCIEEIEQLKDDYKEVDRYDLPLRVTHNDTKLNNILFDKTSRKALCLVDLDTIMPGYIFHDFGDAARTLCNSVEEGDPDHLDAVSFNFEIFEAFLKGYVSQAGQLLTDEEWKSLPISIEFMPFIMAIRFLTDYLFEDKYYKVDFSDQNLIRCKNQLAFIEKIRERRGEIRNVIKSYESRVE